LAVERKGEMRYRLDMTSRRQNQDSAFTLMEMLVVVAIIGILAALLLTAISHAKARAQRIRCVNNLNQLSIGLHMFLGDNQVYPLEVNPDFNNGSFPNHYQSWIAALYNTLELNMKGPRDKAGLLLGIWKCPSAEPPVNLPNTKGYVYYGYNSCAMSSEPDANSLGLGGYRVRRVFESMTSSAV
jgi:prepilin-type N-terminal cleavage/methylation domain-containing protein